MVILLVIVLLLVGAYLWFVSWSAKQEILNAPRVPMFICEKHGPVQDKYVIKFDFDGVLNAPHPICPFCYDEKLRNKKKNA